MKVLGRFGLWAVSGAVGLAVAVLWAPQLEATSMVRLEASELLWIADLVTEAEVLEASPQWDENGRFLRTLYTLEVERTLKGDVPAGDRVEVRELGGRLGTEETHVPSAAIFAPGERVLVYLERHPIDPVYRTVGMSQGKLTRILEEDTGRDILVRVTPPRDLLEFDESEVQLPAARLYLDDLASEVQWEINQDFVPDYRVIPGLPAEKDEALRLANEGGER